jgi:hypothetical protein
MRDLSAFADGFTEIDIGAKTTGSKMIIGDAKDGPVGVFDFYAKFTDTVKLAADEIVVAGDVQSSAAIYTNSRLLEVRRQNFYSQLGANSGLHGTALDISVSEQALVGGVLVADASINLKVAGSTGSGGYVSYGPEINSLTTDMGSVIRAIQASGHVTVETSGSIISAAGVFADGAGASIVMDAGGSMTLLSGATVAAAGAHSGGRLGGWGCGGGVRLRVSGSVEEKELADTAGQTKSKRDQQTRPAVQQRGQPGAAEQHMIEAEPTGCDRDRHRRGRQHQVVLPAILDNEEPVSPVHRPRGHQHQRNEAGGCDRSQQPEGQTESRGHLGARRDTRMEGSGSHSDAVEPPGGAGDPAGAEELVVAVGGHGQSQNKPQHQHSDVVGAHG